MHKRLLKEIRLVAPAWLLTAVLSFSPALFRLNHEWALTFLGVGCAAVVACSFGSEFTYGTLASLLAQPIDRRRIWFEKLGTLATILFPLVAGTLAVYFGKMPKPNYWMLLILPACALCSTPFLALLTRNTVGAVVLSVGAPFLICLGGGALVLWLFKTNALIGDPALDEFINEEKLHRLLFWYFGLVLPLYCVVLYGAGYRRFLRLQVANTLDRQIRLGTFLHSAFERIIIAIFSRKRRSLGSLLGKEVRLHQHTITLFVIFTAVQLAAVAFIIVAKPNSPENYFALPLTIYAILVPLAAGASAFAEEEKLGIRAWQLTIPLSLRAQWWVKIVVAFSILAVLGTAVPWTWLLIAKYVGPVQLLPREFLAPDAITLMLVYQVLAMTAALYASSLSRDTLRAILGAIGVLVGLWTATAAIVYTSEWIVQWEGNPLRSLVGLLAPAARIRLVRGFEYVVLVISCLGLGVWPLAGSFWNFRTVDRSRQNLCVNALLTYVPGVLVVCLLINVQRALWLVYSSGK